MLGENLGTISGPTSMKALPAINGSPVFETVASGLTGTLAGAEVRSFATYSARMRADGSFQGECPNSGVIMTSDGVATFSATGVGSPTEDGGFVFIGVVYFETTAPSLSSLNGIAVVYDWTVDPTGNATWELWEWKEHPYTKTEDKRIVVLFLGDYLVSEGGLELPQPNELSPCP